jgi:hypothetical protein
MLAEELNKTYQAVLTVLRGGCVFYADDLACTPSEALDAVSYQRQHPLATLVLRQAGLFETINGALGLEFARLVCKFVLDRPFEPRLTKHYRLSQVKDRLGEDWVEIEKRSHLSDLQAVLAVLPSAAGYSLDLSSISSDLRVTALRSCLGTRVRGQSDDFSARVRVLRQGSPSEVSHLVYAGLLLQAGLRPAKAVKVLLVAEVAFN